MIQPETKSNVDLLSFLKIPVLVLLAAVPLVYFPGFTYHYTYLKLPLFQCAAALSLGGLLLKRWEVRPRLAALAPAAALFGWMLLSMLWHSHSWAAPESLVREGSFLAGFVGLSFLLSTPQNRKLYAQWLLAGAVVAAAFIIVFLMTGSPNYFGNRNFAGGFLVLPIVALLAYIIGPSEKVSATRYWSLIIALMAMAYALLLTNSRGAQAGAILGAAIVAFVMFKQLRKAILLAGIAAVIAATAIAIIQPSLVQQFFDVRLLIWQGTLKLIATAPVLGHGVGTFAATIRPFLPVEYFAHPAAAAATLHAHSYPLEILSELGVVGLLLYGSLLAGLAVAAWRAYKCAADSFDRALIVGVAAGLAGMVLHGLVSVGPTAPDVQISFWVGAAFICAAMGPKLQTREKTLPFAAAVPVILLAAVVVFNWGPLKAQRLMSAAIRETKPDVQLTLLNQAQQAQPYENSLTFAIRMKKAAAYFAQNDLASAKKQYQQIDALSPNFGGIAASISQTDLYLNDFDAAVEQAKRAAQQNPFALNAYPIWLQALERAAAKDGQTQPTAELQASAVQAATIIENSRNYKKFEQTVAGFRERVAKLHALDVKFFDYTLDIPRSVLYEADFAKFAGQQDRAGALYGEVTDECALLARMVGLHPVAAGPIFNLWMQVASDSGDEQIYKAGAQMLHQLLNINDSPLKKFPPLYYQLGVFYYYSGQQDLAVDQLQKVARWCQSQLQPGQPDQPEVMQLLAQVYAILDPPMSAQVARALLKQDPNNNVARQLLFRYQLQKKQQEQHNNQKKNEPADAAKKDAEAADIGTEK